MKSRKRRISKQCLCGCGQIVPYSSASWVKGHWTPVNRFWLKVEKGPGCWEWKGSNTGNAKGYGHGRFFMGGKHVMATHFMWTEILGREIPENHYILHKCDNPSCVNPDHLEVGTLAENTQQMWDRERKERAPYFNKLNERMVRFVRRSHMKGKTEKQITRKLRKKWNVKVTSRTVKRIITGETWKHVT